MISVKDSGYPDAQRRLNREMYQPWLLRQTDVFVRLTAGDIFYSRRTARNSVDADKLFYRGTTGAGHVPRLWRLHDELVFYARIKLC